MPRVLPKRRFGADELVRAWQSFSVDLPDGTALTIPRRTVLLGSHVAVVAAPQNFVSTQTPDDQEPRVFAGFADEGKPMFEKPTRLRLRHRVLFGGKTYEAGQEAEFPPRTAEWLVSDGHAEVV
jgi:hypothetical protein